MSWSTCSATCGEGIQVRVGMDGETEQRKCNQEPCPCKPGYQCIKRGKCIFYQAELNRSKKFGEGSQAKIRIIDNLKSLICNKRERKVCCKTEDDNPTSSDNVTRSGK